MLSEAAESRKLVVDRVLVPGGRSSVVVLVRCADGAPAVLKLAPCIARPRDERAAPALWQGLGAVRLLDLDQDGAPDMQGNGLLLERLRPDVSLHSLPESRSVLEATETVRRLWVEPPPRGVFETVTERTGRQGEAMRAPLVDEDARDVPGVGALTEAALVATPFS